MPTSPPRFGLVKQAAPKAWQHATGKTTTERGYGWQHQKARDRLLRNEPLCRECRKHHRTTIATIADHIVPLSEGGSRDETNLQPLCRPCSDAKTKREAQRGRVR